MESSSSSPTKTCPTCGTRIAQDTPKCLVCGTAFEVSTKKGKPGASSGTNTKRSGNEITLSAPVLAIILIVFLAAGAGLVYGALSVLDVIAETTPVPTETTTPMPSQTLLPPSATATNTPLPTFTPLSYFVKFGDTCSSIANTFNISIESIILANNLDENCNFLGIDDELRIPHPTATPIPPATSTMTGPELTRAACNTYDHVVQENETMSMIAFSYAVPQDIIMDWNNLTADIVFLGQKIEIPLCFVVSVGGSTVTPSPAPEYQAPELLLPRSGEFYDASNDTISLQWASIGELRDNEFYQVTVIDITSGSTIRVVSEVKETEYNVPLDLKPTGSQPHVFQWFVVPVAQVGVRPDGTPIFNLGGPASNSQLFSWAGESPQVTPGP